MLIVLRIIIYSNFLVKMLKIRHILLRCGLRYIDAAKAVGSNADGEWYGNGTEYDYQSTDNVHPSEYGAKAIATQFLIDFPEIMQY